jgi:hypothetical protein
VSEQLTSASAINRSSMPITVSKPLDVPNAIANSTEPSVDEQACV